MIVEVKKIGNSLFVPLPSAANRLYGINEKDKFDFTIALNDLQEHVLEYTEVSKNGKRQHKR